MDFIKHLNSKTYWKILIPLVPLVHYVAFEILSSLFLATSGCPSGPTMGYGVLGGFAVLIFLIINFVYSVNNRGVNQKIDWVGVVSAGLGVLGMIVALLFIAVWLLCA